MENSSKAKLMFLAVAVNQKHQVRLFQPNILLKNDLNQDGQNPSETKTVLKSYRNQFQMGFI